MRRAVAIVLTGLGITACRIGETNYETATYPIREQKETRTCDSPFVLADTSKMKPCGDGKSHCFPAAKTSWPKEEFPACEGDDICLPDALLLANGKKATECDYDKEKGKKGACMPIAVKQIGQYKDALPKAEGVCQPDERCAPCIHPLDGTDTHVCDPQGVHDVECTGGPGEAGSVEVCCHGMGICTDVSAVPESSREDMSREVCSEGRLCAPAAMADNKPVKCEVLGFDGVCLDVCFATMLRGVTNVTRGGCGPTELCLPCAIGSGQGMPGCD